MTLLRQLFEFTSTVRQPCSDDSCLRAQSRTAGLSSVSCRRSTGVNCRAPVVTARFAPKQRPVVGYGTATVRPTPSLISYALLRTGRTVGTCHYWHLPFYHLRPAPIDRQSNPCSGWLTERPD
eukprot:1408056-Rhodomonas_salina.1